MTDKKEKSKVWFITGTSRGFGHVWAENGVFVIDISNYPDGIYFLRSSSPKGSKTVRLIKTN